MRCTMRQLKDSDADSWTRLRNEALQRYPLAFGATAPADAKMLNDTFHIRIGEPEASIFGAFVDGSLVGTVGIRREPGLKERHKTMI